MKEKENHVPGEMIHLQAKHNYGFHVQASDQSIFCLDFASVKSQSAI